jgi:hypothetical protein
MVLVGSVSKVKALSTYSYTYLRVSSITSGEIPYYHSKLLIKASKNTMAILLMLILRGTKTYQINSNRGKLLTCLELYLIN